MSYVAPPSDYLPVFFQACLGATPIRSGVDMLATALIIAPFALAAGITVQAMNKYRPVNLVGWIITVVGFGLLSMLKADDAVGKWVGYQIVASIGTGVIVRALALPSRPNAEVVVVQFASTFFPILAPLPVERTASALAFFAFLRAFAQTWGIAISSTILQNELKRTLPAAFVSMFPDGVEIAYAAIPQIRLLDDPLNAEVRKAFASSMSLIWQTMIGISGLGLLTVALLHEVPMKAITNERYGLEVAVRREDTESVKEIVVSDEKGGEAEIADGGPSGNIPEFSGE